MASDAPLNGPRYRRILLVILSVAALYLALPTLALMVSSRFYVRMPLPVTYIVLVGAIVAAALYLEDGVKQRAIARSLGAAAALVASTILLYATLGYCPT